MGRKSSIDKALEAGDWAAEENKAAAELRKSGAQIRQARVARDEPEAVRRFEGLTLDTPEPADSRGDLIEEYRDDPASRDESKILPDDDGAQDDILPDDAQERAFAPPSGPEPLQELPPIPRGGGGTKTLRKSSTHRVGAAVTLPEKGPMLA